MSSLTLRIWFDAIRPRTLPLAMISILVGSGLAYKQNSFSTLVFLLAIVTALLLQILSNLANDFGDSLKGTDNEQRIGPKRAMQQGLVSVNEMKKALGFNMLLIAIFGSLLIFYSLKSTQDVLSFIFWGILAILAALFYTLGNKPYGYQGLGDLSVLIFFGWLAVLGSYYLHTGEINLAILLPATATGLLAVAVLNINNLRDIENDRLCNKHTLAVRIGEKKARIYHQILLFCAFGFFISFTILNDSSLLHWLFFISLPLALKHAKSVWQAKSGEEFQPMLAQIVKLAVVTNLLFIAPFFILS